MRDFATRSRAGVQTVSMIQQRLRVTKVLALQQKKATKPESASRQHVTLQCDILDRVADSLHQVLCSTLQTILLCNAYLRQFKATEIKSEEQLRLRDSTLFSLRPTQACLVTLHNTRASLSLEQQDAISISLKCMSQSLGGAGKGGPPVNPNKGNNNNTGGGRGNALKRNRSTSCGRKRNRSNSAKRNNNGGGPHNNNTRKGASSRIHPRVGSKTPTPRARVGAVATAR
jgi:hypothetical protein